MDENEIYGVLENFKTVIEALENRVSEMDTMYHDAQAQNDERFHNIEKTLYDDLLNPVKETLAQQEKEDAIEAYRQKYGGKLDVYNERLRAFEGPDFDLSREGYEGWQEYEPPEGEEGYTEEEYVDALVQMVEEQLASIKEALGVPEDSTIKVEETSDGEAKLSVDDKVIETEEAPKSEKEEKLEEEDDEETSKEDLKKLEEEMRKEGLI